MSDRSFTGLNLPHRFRFLQRELKDAGVLQPIGEIDLLIADPRTRRLWLCEIKDPVAPFSSATLRAYVGRFVRPSGGYVSKLLDKADQIRRYQHEAARACGVDDTDPWRVIPVMITRRVEPAAYVRDPRVAFVLPRQLSKVLDDPQDPKPGHLWPGALPAVE